MLQLARTHTHINAHTRAPFDERVAFDEGLDVVLEVLLGDFRFDETFDDVDRNDFGALEPGALDVMGVALFDFHLKYNLLNLIQSSSRHWT